VPHSLCKLLVVLQSRPKIEPWLSAYQRRRLNPDQALRRLGYSRLCYRSCLTFLSVTDDFSLARGVFSFPTPTTRFLPPSASIGCEIHRHPRSQWFPDRRGRIKREQPRATNHTEKFGFSLGSDQKKTEPDRSEPFATVQFGVH